MTNTVNPSDLKVGDRVRVTFEGVMLRDVFGSPFLNVSLDVGFSDALKVAKAIEVLPPKAKPLEVGEEVTYGTGAVPNKVLCVHEGVAWIDCGYSNRLMEVSELRRPSGIPIKETE